MQQANYFNCACMEKHFRLPCQLPEVGHRSGEMLRQLSTQLPTVHTDCNVRTTGRRE